MSSFPQLGTKDQLDPNGATPSQDAHNGLVTFYPFGDNQTRPAVISINGDNGGIDIGGTRDRDGKLLIRDKWMTITYIIDGQTGTASQSGDIVLYDANGKERVRISGKTADITIKNPAGDIVAHLDGKIADLALGGGGQGGDVIVKDPAGNETVRLAGSTGEATVGGNGQAGAVSVKNAAGAETIHLNGSDGAVKAGNLDAGNIKAGDLDVGNIKAGDLQVSDIACGNVTATEVKAAKVAAGVVETNDLQATDITTTNVNAGTVAATTVNSTNVNATTVTSTNANATNVNATHVSSADITLGGAVNGKVSVRGKDNKPLVELIGQDSAAVIGVGAKNRAGRISVYGADALEKVTVDGATGDIILCNADCAEDFDVAPGVEPGTVMVLMDDGALAPSSRPYDSRVAGVISGAGDYRPGMVLDKQKGRDGRMPVALIGKVYCKVDASFGPVRAGDLLTTAPTPGHAMKASDPDRAFGAVIGKALRPLPEGAGLIPIIVALQ